MRTVYFGTSDFAVPPLRAIAASPDHEIALVVTQPARRRRRGGKAETTPVGHAADELGIATFSPESVRDPDALERLTAIEADVAVVASYGQFLPKPILEWPRHGCVNVHASLLPRWRGATPVARAILAGDVETGISIIRLVRKMDAGAVILRRATPIEPHETTGELEARLAELGAACILDSLADLDAGRAVDEQQDEALVTLAPRFEKSDGLIPWASPADVVARHVRGMSPRPGAKSTLRRPGADDAGVTVARCRVATPATDGADAAGAAGAEPGTVVATAGDGPTVATGEGGAVVILDVVPPGKKRMAAADWVRGRGIDVGDRLG